MSLQECSATGNPQLLKYGHQDTGNAQRFAHRWGNDFKWCPDSKMWLHWDTKRWGVDHTDKALRHAKLTMAEFYQQAIAEGDEVAQKFARSSLNISRLRALLEAAKPELAIRAADLDTDPFLLNCQN